MKKYRLKKDLPLAKAGTVVKILQMFNNEEYYGIRKYNEEYKYFSLGYIKDDILNEWLEEIEEKPKSVWEFKKGDDYFCIKNGQVLRYQWTNDAVDNDIVLTGDAFVSLEEAEKELERREAIQKIKKYCWENGIETDYKKIENGKFCYLIAYDFLNDRLSIIRISEVNIFYSPIGYFSEENAEKILEKFENELKIILDV